MNQLDKSALKARNNLLIMFSIYLLLDVCLVAVSRDMWAISRILVTVVVMYFVLRGYRWAKWFLVGLFSVLVMALTALIIALYSKLSTFLIVGSIATIILSIMINIYLVLSKNLHRYFSYQRQAS